MQIPSYTDGSGTYVPGDHVIYDGRLAVVMEIDRNGPDARVCIMTVDDATPAQVITTPGLDPRWDSLAAPPGYVHEYRCTRPSLYPKGSPGERDVTARQGHYVFATNRGAALAKMKAEFPGEPIDVPHRPCKVILAWLVGVGQRPVVEGR